MYRFDHIAAAIPAFVCLILFFVGCGSDSPLPNEQTAPVPEAKATAPDIENHPETHDSTAIDDIETETMDTADVSPGEPTDSTHSETKSTAQSEARPLLKDWPEPKLAIVITGEIHGYFEPCGCTENQSGGMSRRADLITKMEDRGWSVTGLDLGGMLKRNRRQDQIKYETILASLTEMKYTAVGLGPEELRFGPEVFLQLHNPEPEKPETTPSFVSANVTMLETPDLGKLPYKIVTINRVKIGVTSILGLHQRREVFGESEGGDMSAEDAEAALPAVIEALKAESPDLLVLLSHADQDESKVLAEKFPEFQLIVTAGGVEDPNGIAQKVGETTIIDVGHKGKHAGVIGFYPDAEQNFKFELVELDRRFGDNMKMIEQMRYYQDRLKSEQLAYTEPPLPHPSGAHFVGAEKCGECHTKAYEKWLTTKHSHATESITHAREGQPAYGITRIYDPECLACHSTGWNPKEYIRYDGGFVNEEFAQTDDEKTLSKLLQGQQCENCHGPGSKHIELVDAGEIEEAKKLTHLDLETAKANVCYKCHDLDNSPHFNFEKYWKEIAHPWRD
ncbi:MAG: multiheme c-type cytochrome [Planctomycetota bacterium]|nr:multiheme c-type cytochrome [Planctomycetota bacterium]MDA1212446.1 multiheme c-type cytochrome [Planctomycetota bacterium]